MSPSKNSVGVRSVPSVVSRRQFRRSRQFPSSTFLRCRSPSAGGSLPQAALTHDCRRCISRSQRARSRESSADDAHLDQAARLDRCVEPSRVAQVRSRDPTTGFPRRSTPNKFVSVTDTFCRHLEASYAIFLKEERFTS